MNSIKGYSQYRDQSVLTAGPGELVLMLYDGCIKQIKLSRLALAEDLPIQYSQHLIKAQDFIAELMLGLDFDYELSQDIYRIYDYLANELMLANVEKDTTRIDVVETIMDDLRQTWSEAVQKTRQQTMVMAVGSR